MERLFPRAESFLLRSGASADRRQPNLRWRRFAETPLRPLDKPAPAPPHPVPTLPRPKTSHPPYLAFSVLHPRPAPIPGSSIPLCGTLDRVIHPALRDPARRQRRPRIQLGRHDAGNVTSDGESCHTSPVTFLGANPCKPMSGKPTVATHLILLTATEQNDRKLHQQHYYHHPES